MSKPTVEQVARRLANEDDTLWEYLSTFRQDYWLRQASAVLALFEDEPSTGAAEMRLAVYAGWLVQVVDHHTCGTAPGGHYGAHEPGCGAEPVMPLDQIEGWHPARETVSTAEELDALPVGSVVQALDAGRAGSLRDVPIAVRQSVGARTGDWYAGWGWEFALPPGDIVPATVISRGKEDR